MAEPSISEMREVYKAYLVAQGMTEKKAVDYLNALNANKLKSLYIELMARKSKEVFGQKYNNDQSFGLKFNVGTPETLDAVSGAKATANVGQSRSVLYDADTANIVSGSSAQTPGSAAAALQSSLTPEDPCKLLTGSAKYNCYINLRQQAQFAGEEDKVSYWDQLAMDAEKERTMAMEDDTLTFTKSKEQQRILENIKSLSQQGIRDTSSMIDKGISNLNETLNKGIVMAPGQEYLFGQEPGGVREKMMASRGIPWTATKFPAIPVDYMQGADYSAQENEKLQGNAIYPSSGAPIYPDKIDATASTPQKSVTNFSPSGDTLTTKSGTQYAGKESGMPTASGKWEQYQDDFVKANIPLAKQAADKTGLPIELVLAMTANETGWGVASKEAPFGLKDYSGKGVSLATTEGAEKTATVEPFKAIQSLGNAYDDFVWEISDPKSHWYGAPKDISGFLSYIQGGNPMGLHWANDTKNGVSTGQYQSQIESLAQQIRNQLEKKYDYALPLNTPPPEFNLAYENQQRANVVR